MPRLPALVEFVAERFSREPTFVATVARHCREAGLIARGKPGRGANTVTARDAATLMIALATSPIALHAVERFKLLANLVPLVTDANEMHLPEYISRGRQWASLCLIDVIEQEIQSSRDEHGILFLPNQTSFVALQSISISAVTDYYSQAEIRYWISSRVQPDKEGFIKFIGPGKSGNQIDLMNKEEKDGNFAIDREIVDAATVYNYKFVSSVGKFISGKSADTAS